jgi:hypothetical protein
LAVAVKLFMGITFLEINAKQAKPCFRLAVWSMGILSFAKYNRNRGFCKPCVGQSRRRNNSLTRKIWEFEALPLAFSPAEQ